MWRTFCWAAIPACLMFCSAIAEAQQSTDKRAEFNAVFQETLKKPTDAPTLLRYARLAVEVGDLEAAVSAYERFLMIDGDQPRVRYELGVLYYRLRSYEAARAYFESARTSSRAGADVQAGAGEYLAEIDRMTGKSRFSGDVLVGLRYSNNANNANSGALRFFGSNVLPNPAFSQRADWAAVTAAQLHHRYDFGRQDSGTLETDLSVYSSRQFQVSEANTLLFDLTTGPRSQPFEGAFKDVTLKPFVTGRYVSVHDQPTYWSWGAGTEATAQVRDWLKASVVVLGRHREFIDNADAPSNSRSSGTDAATGLQLQAEINPDILLTLGLGFTRYLAAVPSESYSALAYGASLSFRFSDPVGLNGRKWYLTANAGGAAAGYDAADPTIDPAITRQQADLNLGLLLSVPLDERLTLVGQTTYFQRTAPISNYAFQAFNTLVGVNWRF